MSSEDSEVEINLIEIIDEKPARKDTSSSINDPIKQELKSSATRRENLEINLIEKPVKKETSSPNPESVKMKKPKPSTAGKEKAIKVKRERVSWSKATRVALQRKMYKNIVGKSWNLLENTIYKI